VAIGACVGAPSRFLLDAAITRRVKSGRPWGTVTVNCSGSAILGLLAGLLVRKTLPEAWYWLLGVGFCGAYTTLSTFTWETVALAEARRSRDAALNVTLSLIAGLGIAFATYALAK
jgi:CrcB protein